MSSDWMEDVKAEVLAAEQAAPAQDVPAPEVESFIDENEDYSQSMDDSDFDVPSSLDTIDGYESDSSSDETPAEAPAVSEAISDLVRYSANGKEFTATAEEAAKALSLVQGARRAFTERAKLRREMKQLKEEIEQSRVYKEKWQEVMADGANPQQVWEKLTGISYEQWADSEMQRRQLYAQASPEEKQVLDYGRKFQELEAKQQKMLAEQAAREEKLQSTAFEARVKYMQSQAAPIFEKYSSQITKGLSESAGSRRARMFWRESVRDLQDLKQQGYNPTPKVMEQVFRRNAAAMVGGNLDQVEQKVQQVINQKKMTAKEQAQVASTRNYSGPSHNVEDLVNKNPLDLFNLFKKS